MKPNEKLIALVERFPGATNHAIADDAAAEQVQNLADELLAGGAEAISALADLLVEPGKSTPQDAKARFLLHAVVVRVGEPGKEMHRKQLATWLASALADTRSQDANGCLIRELQWIATAENAPAVGAFLADETLRDDAARTLHIIGGEAAAVQFRGRLSKATDKERLTLLLHLGTLRDAQSADAFQSAATFADVQLRVIGVWSLANLGQPSSVATVLKAADAEGSERVQHTKSCLLLAERLAANGHKKEARGIYQRLQERRTDPSESYVRQAAERSLAAIK